MGTRIEDDEINEAIEKGRDEERRKTVELSRLLARCRLLMIGKSAERAPNLIRDIDRALSSPTTKAGE